MADYQITFIVISKMDLKGFMHSCKTRKNLVTLKHNENGFYQTINAFVTNRK
jgi:hypothetical protein